MNERVNSIINANEILGSGNEKIVYGHRYSPELAVGIFYNELEESRETIKARYYLTKTAHLLFPDIFPNIHLAFANPHLVAMDKVIVDNEIRDKKIKSNDFATDLRALFKKVQKAGIEVDTYHNNFHYDQASNLYYLDTLRPWREFENLNKFDVLYDKEKLRTALSQLLPKKQLLGKNYLMRLELLKTQEFNNFQLLASRDHRTIQDYAENESLIPVTSYKHEGIGLVKKDSSLVGAKQISWEEWFRIFDAFRLPFKWYLPKKYKV